MLFIFAATFTTLALWGSILPLPVANIHPDQSLATRAKGAFTGAFMAQALCNVLSEISPVLCPWPWPASNLASGSITDLIPEYIFETDNPPPESHAHCGCAEDIMSDVEHDFNVMFWSIIAFALGNEVKEKLKSAADAQEQPPQQEELDDQDIGSDAPDDSADIEDSPAAAVPSGSGPDRSSNDQTHESGEGAVNPGPTPEDSSPEAGPSSPAEAPVVSSPEADSSSSHLTGQRPDVQQVDQEQTDGPEEKKKKKNRPSKDKRKREAKRRAAELGLVTEEPTS